MNHTFIMDVDGTICNAPKKEDGTYDYPNAIPITPVIERINQLYDEGHKIIIFTARGHRTYSGNIKKIKENVQPVLEAWLKNHEVKYHELQVGKPWGENPVYVDDRALSVKNFATSAPEFFENILKAENNI